MYCLLVVHDWLLIMLLAPRVLAPVKLMMADNDLLKHIWRQLLIIEHLLRASSTKSLCMYRVGDCGLLAQCLDELAVKHPGTKFVKIISTDCIPKYPDQNLPTVLLYRNTQLKQHLVGLLLYGGRNTTSAGEQFGGQSWDAHALPGMLLASCWTLLR